MIINGYDTLIGKPLKVQEHIEETIKMLKIRNDLLPTTKNGVYTVNAINAVGIPIFPLPITMTGYDGKFITVYDERPFRNNNNVVISQSELNIMRLTAYLQQDAIENNFTIINKCKFICVKALAGSISERLGHSKGLDSDERDNLRIIMAHYVNCLFEGDTPETGYVSSNVINTVFKINASVSQTIIDDVGYLGNVAKLVDAIKAEPTLFKLKNLTLMEMIAMTGRLSFIGTGAKVVNVMLESPFLTVGFIYATCKNRMYAKTPIGLQLDPKYNRDLVDSFVQTITYNYDLDDVK